MTQEWSIQQIAKLADTTSRTLRHYGEVGLLPPSRVALNGYRYYDAAALVRLQRILLLRELGLALPHIAEILARPTQEVAALGGHLDWLHAERARIERQIAAVTHTMTALQEGEKLMPENMFDGFDHTVYKEEVQQRWGADAYAAGDAWWKSQSDSEKQKWKDAVAALNRDWQDAAARGISADGAEAQHLAARHVEWLLSVPGTPAEKNNGDLDGYLLGLGEMYVADPRFAANYGGSAGATFVRDALAAYVAARAK